MVYTIMDFREFLDKASLLRWFGKSKVVDERGMPKRVYHGSPEPVFSKFSLSSKRATRHEAGTIGIWFTDASEVAGTFAQGLIQFMSRTLQINGPMASLKCMRGMWMWWAASIQFISRLKTQ